MKKMYESPWMDIVIIHAHTPLLAGSVMGPGGDNEMPGAPEYNPFDEWDESLDDADFEFGDDCELE